MLLALLFSFLSLKQLNVADVASNSIIINPDIITGKFSNNEIYLTDPQTIKISDSVFYDFTRNCINIIELESNFSCNVENSVFYNFNSPYRGGAIFIANHGELHMDKICTSNCQTTSKNVAGAFLFTIYHSKVTSSLLSLVNCPGFDQLSMASLCYGAYNLNVGNVNSSYNTGISFAFDLKVECIASFLTVAGNYLEGKAIDACMLTSRTQLKSANFLNNTVHTSDNDAVSIFSAEYRVSPYDNQISGCSFINNHAMYIIYSINSASLNVANTYFDQGIIYSGVDYTYMVDVEQTIQQNHFATMGLCQTNGIQTYSNHEQTEPSITPSKPNSDQNKGANDKQNQNSFLENGLVPLICVLCVVALVVIGVASYSIFKKSKALRIFNELEEESDSGSVTESTKTSKPISYSLMTKPEKKITNDNNNNISSSSGSGYNSASDNDSYQSDVSIDSTDTYH